MLTATEADSRAQRTPGHTSLDLTGHALPHPSAALSTIGNLCRLSLACNALSSLQGLPELRALTRLDVAYNDLRTLFPLPALPALLSLQVRLLHCSVSYRNGLVENWQLVHCRSTSAAGGAASQLHVNVHNLCAGNVQQDRASG